MIANGVRVGIRWGVVLGAIGQALSWVVTIWVIRILEPADFAIIALADLVVGSLAVIGNLGISAALVRSRKFDDEQINIAFTVLFASNIILFLLVMGSASILSGLLGDARLSSLLMFASIVFVLNPITVTLMALAHRDMRFRLSSSLGLAARSMQLAANLILALMGFGFWALAVGNIVFQLTMMVGLLIFIEKRLRLDWHFSRAKALITDSHFDFLSNIGWSVHERMDAFFLNQFSGTDSLGVFRVMRSLAEKPISLVSSVVARVGVAAFSRVAEDMSLVNNYLVKSSQVMALVTFPVFLGMASISENLIPLILGEDWGASSRVFALLCVLSLLRSLERITGLVLFSIGHGRRKVIHTAAIVLISGIAWFFGLQFGFLEGCAAYVVGYAIWFCPHIADAKRYIDFSGYLSAIFPPAFAATVMAAVVLAVPYFFAEDSRRVMIVMVQVLAGVSVYFTINVLFFRKFCLTTMSYLRMKA